MSDPETADPGPAAPVTRTHRADIAVLGGGMAGLATALRLTDAGRSVTVVDDGSRPRPTLGESLEFTAPTHLAELGLDPDELLASGIGHPKGNVLVTLVGDTDLEIWPPGWFRRPPFFAADRTLHIDRAGVDDQLRDRARAAGVTMLDDRVMALDATGDRIEGARTRNGRTIQADWWVDASGHRSRLIGRSLGLARAVEGRPWIAYHARLRVAPWVDATLLRFWPEADGQWTWGWIIPLSPMAVSVGLCRPENLVRAERSAGASVDDLFWTRIGTVPELEPAAADRSATVASVAYRPFHHRRTSGANWVLVGDAAALVDPVTSGGVAASLRGAATAAALVDTALFARPQSGLARRGADRRSRRARAAHHHVAARMVSTANVVADRVLFRNGVRRLVGGWLTVFVFAAPVLVVNAWYRRFRPYRHPFLAVHRVQCTTVGLLARLLGRLPGAQAGSAAVVEPASSVMPSGAAPVPGSSARARNVSAVGSPVQSNQR